MRNDLSIYRTYAPNWWDGSQKFLRLLQNIVPARMKYFSGPVGSWQDKTVLDLGCGGGFMAETLAKQGAKVIGVEPSEPAVEAARVHARQENLAIEYKVGSGEAIPLEENSVDHVVCVDVLEHVEDLNQVLDEIARVLRPGGLFLFDTINRTWIAKFVVVQLGETVFRFLPRGTHDPEKFIKPSELKQMLEGRGFASGKTVGLGPRGLNRQLDFTFGRMPTSHIMYMGYAELKV